MKEKLFNKLPFILSSFSYFCYRYFLLLGFLDGKKGLIFHFLHAFWYRFLVGIKIEEFNNKIKTIRTKKLKLKKLSEISNYKI